MKRLSLLVFLSLFLVHCSQLKRRGEGQGVVSGEKRESSDWDSETLPPQISNPSAKKIGLVLGAGGARTLAYAGLIRSFKKNKIEISHIAATEWASLVGASFSLGGEVHDMDWKLYKLEGLGLKFDKGFLGLGGNQASSDLPKYLADNFNGQRVESAKIPFVCASRSLGANQSVLLSRGAAPEVLKRCLPSPPFFGSYPQAASPASMLKLASYLKKNGADIVVFVDVLDPSVLKESQFKEAGVLRFSWGQILESHESASLFLKNSYQMDLKSFSIFDFSKRKQLEAEGENQGDKIVQKLMETYRL